MWSLYALPVLMWVSHTIRVYVNLIPITFLNIATDQDLPFMVTEVLNGSDFFRLDNVPIHSTKMV